MAYLQNMVAETGELARLIKGARERRGWSQEHLAQESGVGRRTIVRWETDPDAEPLAPQLKDVTAALGIPVEDAFRAVGWLPAGDEWAPGLDPDEQELWRLGERRGWSEDIRWQIIDTLRGRRMREERRPVATVTTIRDDRPEWEIHAASTEPDDDM